MSEIKATPGQQKMLDRDEQTPPHPVNTYWKAPQKRYCNGVLLDDCLHPWDDLRGAFIFVAAPTEKSCFFDCSNDAYSAMCYVDLGMAYANPESAAKHGEAMRIVEVMDD